MNRARLALLRHGHTAWNRAGRIQGRSDIPLDDAARSELATVCLPAPWGAAQLWSSPLTRAVETAEIVARREPLRIDALIEMHWGTWEGREGRALRSDASSGYLDIEDWSWDYTPPGGESPRAILDRVSPWLNGLEGDHVAVCHIGVMRVLLAMAWAWDFKGTCPFAIKRNRLFVLTKEITGWTPKPDPIRLEIISQ